MITLVIGPMFSGKTTELLRRLERSWLAKKEVVLLRPVVDSREYLSHTNTNPQWLAQKFVSLNDFCADRFDTIGIDEGQFHDGLDDFCIKYSRLGKNIIISALHATSESTMFPSIIKIIPHCEEIIKLNAVCARCGSEHANYTHYLCGQKKQDVIVGGSAKYIALCRECYFKSDYLYGGE